MPSATTCDAVLVGASVGSLAAAIALAEGGLRPLLVEKSHLVGGGSAYSGGVVWAPDNHRMRAKGLADSADEAMTYLGAIAGEEWDPVVARAYVTHLPRTLEAIEVSTGLKWVTYTGLPDYFAELAGGKTQGRFLLPFAQGVAEQLDAVATEQPALALVRQAIHAPGSESEWLWGRALVGALWSRALGLGVQYMLDTRVTALVIHDAGVIGVGIAGPKGTDQILSRYGVLLGTGGAEWSDELTRRAVSKPRLARLTPPENEGDGQVMAATVGAELQMMDRTIAIPAVLLVEAGGGGREFEPDGAFRLFFQPLCLPHSMVVNRSGRRFANETFFSDVANAWERRPGEPVGDSENLPSFFIFDGGYRGKYGMPQELESGGTIRRHESLADLAADRGIDARGLAAQVSEFNEDLVQGRPDAFGRGGTAYQRAFGDPLTEPNPTIGIVAQPPFYSVELRPSTAGHRGGVRIDAQAHVLRADGSRIRGLYACGNVAAGSVTGARYISGASIGHALVFSRLAAEEMLDSATD